MVTKVKACYVFELEGGEGKYYIDLKEGDGQVGEGEVPNKPADFKPEVKITMSQENMLKMFNREWNSTPYLSLDFLTIDVDCCIKNCVISQTIIFRWTCSCYGIHDG